MANVIYLTKEWLKKLKDELKHLKEATRVEIAAKLKEAISFWDLSENSEYEEARNEQAQVEVRITEIEWQLKNVELIKETKWAALDKVNMWSSVTIVNTEDKEETTYKIVGSTESDILAEEPKISNDSPVWKALLWKKKWDTIKVKALAWNFEYKILKIA